MTTKDLLDTFSEIFEGKEQLGEGEADGIAQGATHKDLFDAIYEEQLASIPATNEGLTQMVGVFSSLPENQHLLQPAFPNPYEQNPYRHQLYRSPYSPLPLHL